MRRAKDVLLPLLLVHAAMMASVIAYGVIAYAASSDDGGAAPLPLDPRVFLAIAGAVAAVAAVAAIVVRARKLARVPAGPGALAPLRAALILVWGLEEAVAIPGLAAAFLYRDASYYAPFGAAALALLAIHAPRPRALVALLDAG